MAWLLRREEVLASLELASSRVARVKGLAGRDRADSPLLVMPSRGAHSLGVRFELDIAYLDSDLTVLALTRLAPNRIARPRRGVAAILQAEAGAFERWKLQVGDCLEIKG